MWTINGEPLSQFGNFIATCILFYVFVSVLHTSSCVLGYIANLFIKRGK